MAQEMVVSKELSYLAELSIGMFDNANYSTTSVPNSISIRQNRFWLVSSEGRAQTPDPLKLCFVTLGVKAPEGRTYYDGAYDPENSAPPDCFSYDGVVPDDRGPRKQADTCGACKQSMWGSATSKLTGAMVPACRTHKDIVIKVMGVDGMWLLRIPPASIRKQWVPLIARIKQVSEKEYAKHGKASLTMLTCVVEATFDDTAQGVLNFKPMGYLGESELPAVTSLARSKEEILQALWGPEGSARMAQWASPKRNSAPLLSPEQDRASINPGGTSPIERPPQPERAPVKTLKEKFSTVEKKETPKIEVKSISPQKAGEANDEVDDILKSMGIFDG